MSRNVQFQVLRGLQAQLGRLQAGIDPDTGSTVNPLQMGEMFFATDTGNFFLGTPGYGVGYIQVGDTTQVNETMMLVRNELRAIRMILTVLATQDGSAKPDDFDPTELGDALPGQAEN
jgi:hypothetical protein